MVDNTTTAKKNKPNPLPYIIIFAILFLIALGVLTWVLSVFYKSYGCNYYPNIWCSDNWVCQNNCTNGIITGTNIPANSCFTNATVPGLASCLYGPNAPGATVCLNPPTNGPSTGGTGLACNCPTGMEGSQVMNCFNGCGSNLDSIQTPGTPVCCCNDPNNPNCAFANGKPTYRCSGTT